jgi:hypothetical protein
MAYFDRSSQPVIMDIGPVLGIEDVIGGKACALASRAEPRDYIDITATLNTYTVSEIINFARRLDPGLEDRDFSDAGNRLDRWGDHIFAAYGLNPSQITALRQHLANRHETSHASSQRRRKASSSSYERVHVCARRPGSPNSAVSLPARDRGHRASGRRSGNTRVRPGARGTPAVRRPLPEAPRGPRPVSRRRTLGVR